MSRDLRRYQQQTTTRLIFGALLLLFLVGDGLIYLIYGKGAALMGLLCIGGAFIPIGITLLILQGMDWIVRRTNKEDK